MADGNSIRKINKGPLLKDLHGMDEARRWGEALTQDLSDYKKGILAWSEVDRGALLHGPPGAGKTTFAKALAATCDVHFVPTSSARWSSAGALDSVLSAIAEDFLEASSHLPSLIFIDEIDGIGSREGGKHNRDWWSAVVAGLLEALDGIEGREGVVVLAAANYPARIDPAILRAGRLDTQIAIELPDAKALKGILRYHLRESLAKVDVMAVALSAVGSSGADIEKLVRTARRSARKEDRLLKLDDLFSALEAGLAPVGKDLLWRRAVHEAGHAIIALVLKLSERIEVSIVRRGTAGGRTVIVRDDDLACMTHELVQRNLIVALAGRAAEQVILNSVSSGSGGGQDSDIAWATDLAYRAATCWGLSRGGRLSWSGPLGREEKAYHPELAAEVEAELQQAYDKAIGLVTANRRSVVAAAEALLARRALSKPDLEKIVRQHKARPRRHSA